MTVEPPPPARRLAQIDGLRGLAALSVLCFHAWLYTRAQPSIGSAHASWERAAVQLKLGLVLFFVLSGFLLYGPWVRANLSGGRRPRLGTYLRHRVARIVPAYYLALIGSVLLLWPHDATPGVRLPAAAELPLFAVFAQNYFDGPLHSLDPPMWTLSVEVAFYCLLPVVGALALALRGGRARQVALPLGLLGAGVAYNWVASARGLSGPWDYTLPAMLPYFAIGMLVAVVAHGRVAGRGASLALALAGAGLVVGDGVWHAVHRSGGIELTIVRDVPAALGCAAIVAAVAHGRGLPARLAGARPLAALGTVSYGVYLWHVPLLLWARSQGLLPHSAGLALAAALPAAVAVATVSWMVVERPALRWARRPARATLAPQEEQALEPDAVPGRVRGDAAHRELDRAGAA